MRKPIARYYQAGPQGGVYYVASSGARVYVDRSTPLGQRSSGSRLVSINPGDKDYGERSSQPVESDAGGFDVLLSLAVLAFVTSFPLGALFGHPLWLLKMPFQLLNALLWAGINS